MTESKNHTKVTSESRILVFVEIVFVFSVMVGLTWMTKTAGLIGAGSIAIWGGIFLATYFMRRRGIKWPDYGLNLPKGKRKWAVGFALALATVITVFISMALIIEPLASFLGLEQNPTASDRFKFFLGKPIVFLNFIVTVVWVGAALGEELFMRGYIMNRLADFFGQGRLGWACALIVQAVIFGAMHSYQGVAGMIATGVIGFVIGLFYIAGKRQLFPVIIAHGIINTIGLTAYYLSDGVIT